jgi:malate dehydrogenase (oxaloacetate-decarboxylating)(NADP+)
MYFSVHDLGQFGPMAYNWPEDDVEVIVVTDGSRILGLGDLGANGMGIPIGKLCLYVAAGGINPSKVLPIMLDLGTNNEELLADPNYMGVPLHRLQDKAYYAAVSEFMAAVYARWPNVLLQFEDFSSDHAQPLLDTYRGQYLCFNDDIQAWHSMAWHARGVASCARPQGAV